jgi:hypothetical protein
MRKKKREAKESKRIGVFTSSESVLPFYVLDSFGSLYRCRMEERKDGIFMFGEKVGLVKEPNRDVIKRRLTIWKRLIWEAVSEG